MPSAMRPLFISRSRVRLPRGGNTCDFCGCPFVAKLYPCENFMWADRAVFRHGFGSWGACHACGVLVDADLWLMLVRRVMKQIRKRAGITSSEARRIRRELRELYALVPIHLRPQDALNVYQPHYIRTNTAEFLC